MKLKVSEYIAKFLEKKGIRHIFGVTGGGAMHLNDAFGKNKKMKFIFFHHEQSASMAAEAYYRVNNIPCLLHTTSGPGATNAITGVTGAWIDSIPVFVISGQVPKRDMINKSKTRQVGVQEINITDIVKPITKFVKVISNAEDIDVILNQAYEKMISGKPGPVWIDVPLDIQAKKIDIKKLKKYKKKTTYKKKDKINFQFIKKTINQSKKPIFIIGNGIHLSNSRKQFVKLLNLVKIPVVSSWNASDIMPTDSKLFVGRAGIFGERAANLAVEHSDLLIILGSRLSIPQTGYDKKNFSSNSKKIFVDIDSNEINSKDFKNIIYKLNIDLNYFHELAIGFFKKNKIKNFKLWSTLLLDWKKKYPVVKNNYNKNSKYFNSFDFINQLSLSLRGKETIVTDMGTSFTCTMQTLKIKNPNNQRLFTSSGLASMGFGLPGAIGAYFANNKNTPICISGDGGLMFNIQELQTVKNYNIPIKLFVLENKGYLTMKLMQKKNFNFITGADPSSGVSFPSFKKIASTFGLNYIKLNGKNMKKNIGRLLKSKKPILAEINMNPYQELTPRLQNKLNLDGTFSLPQYDDLYPYLNKEEIEKERDKARNIE
jgi:acetolactate synthase I/II/III large subunit